MENELLRDSKEFTNELLGKDEEIEIVHLATGVQGLHVSCEQGKQAVPYVRKSELDRVKGLLDEAVKVCESIIKNQYGAQGYVEEEDWKGLSSYWASIVISYQDQARSLIQKLKGGA